MFTFTPVVMVLCGTVCGIVYRVKLQTLNTVHCTHTDTTWQVTWL